MSSCKNSLATGKSWLAQLKQRELKGVISLQREKLYPQRWMEQTIPPVHWDTKQRIGLSCSKRDLDRAGIKSSQMFKEDTQGSLNMGHTKITQKVQQKMR